MVNSRATFTFCGWPLVVLECLLIRSWGHDEFANDILLRRTATCARNRHRRHRGARPGKALCQYATRAGRRDETTHTVGNRLSLPSDLGAGTDGGRGVFSLVKDVACEYRTVRRAVRGYRIFRRTLCPRPDGESSAWRVDRSDRRNHDGGWLDACFDRRNCKQVRRSSSLITTGSAAQALSERIANRGATEIENGVVRPS